MGLRRKVQLSLLFIFADLTGGRNSNLGGLSEDASFFFFFAIVALSTVDLGEAVHTVYPCVIRYCTYCSRKTAPWRRHQFSLCDDNNRFFGTPFHVSKVVAGPTGPVRVFPVSIVA